MIATVLVLPELNPTQIVGIVIVLIAVIGAGLHAWLQGLRR